MITLKCTANSLVKGKLVKVGEAYEVPKSEAGLLVSTNRFTFDKEEKPAEEVEKPAAKKADSKPAAKKPAVKADK